MFDFAELFTKAARQVVPTVLERKLVFSFDCSPAAVIVDRDAEPLRGAIHRLFTAIVDVARTGFVSFTALSRITDTGAVEIVIQAGCVGSMACAPDVEAVASRLGLRHQRTLDRVSTATGHWASVDADVELHVAPREGALLSMRMTLDDATWEEQVPVWAHDARAWLVNANPTLADAWSRRFQRLGWAISRFSSYATAIQQLQEQPDSARPSIVVAVETGDPDLRGTAALSLALPCWTRFIHAVPAGSPSLRDPASIAGCTCVSCRSARTIFGNSRNSSTRSGSPRGPRCRRRSPWMKRLGSSSSMTRPSTSSWDAGWWNRSDMRWTQRRTACKRSRGAGPAHRTRCSWTSTCPC